MRRALWYLKPISLCCVLAISAWLLRPPGGEVEGVPGTIAHPQRGAKHVIRLSPGMQYLPGTVPYGIGEPLEGMAKVARAFEARYPDTRIEIITTPGTREYLTTQLMSERAPDIVNVNVEDVWTDVQKGWYVPLDAYLEAPNPFVREREDGTAPGFEAWWDMFKYQAISRGKAAPDGLNYCITFDMVETGIFYNKDLFAKAGVGVPETWEELLANMAKLEAAGHLPLIMHIGWFNDWCTDLFFDQLYYGILGGIDLVQDPVREGYLAGYLDWDEISFLYKKGFFTSDDPRYQEIWQIMKSFRRYCSDNLSTADPTREFVTQHGAMIWNASPFTYRLLADMELDFEWGIFYLPPFTSDTSRFASGEAMCVIGGSATQLTVTNSAYRDTGDPATSERLERVMAFLQFLTLPENYGLVVNEYDCFLPNVLGVPVAPSLQPFADILDRRYTTTKWVFTFDLKFNEIQRRMLELYLNDGIDLAEFMRWQEGNLTAATENVLLRKSVDLDRLEQRWETLSSVRADYEGLPDGA
jgi:raffinose/stachyose/melibiose transport system substrate-binding protein